MITTILLFDDIDTHFDFDLIFQQLSSTDDQANDELC